LSAYGKLVALIEGLIRALCWSHFRRDFVDAGKSLNALKPWADFWVSRIADIYRLNDRRLAMLDRPELFDAAQTALEDALGSMLKLIRAELEDPNLNWQQEKVLASAVKNWDGLTVFADTPLVPMDNNVAERALRPGALGRKSYYGTHSEWSGRLLASSMSILQTAARHGLKAEAYLRYYLDACARSGGPPKDLEDFLPWNIPDKIIREYSMAGRRERPG
jgi:transposase